MPYDANGQPLASTLADYILPGPTEIPNIRIHHFETPSPHTEFGAKGMGEGGAIAPPAVLFNAVNDALRDFGVELLETPLTPRRLLAALAVGKGLAAKGTGRVLGHATEVPTAGLPQVVPVMAPATAPKTDTEVPA